METNWMKRAGIVLGTSMALVLAPAFASADEQEANDPSGGEVQEDQKLLNVGLDEVPLLGDVKVEVPQKEENPEEKSLANVSLEDSVVGDLDAQVLTDKGNQEEEGSSSKKAVADVSLEDSVVDSVQADVISRSTSADESGVQDSRGVANVQVEDSNLNKVDANVLNKTEAETPDGVEKSQGVVHAETEDVPVVGQVHADVIYEHEQESDDSSQDTKSGVKVSTEEGMLGGIVEDADISILESDQSVSEEGTESADSAATVDVTTPLTDQVDLGVLSDKKKETRAQSVQDSGAVELNTEDLPLLGDTHVGVLDRHTAEDDKQESVSEGVVQADLAGDLLDGLHAGVLERQQAEMLEKQEESAALLTVDATTPLTDQVDLGVLSDKKKDTGVQSVQDSGAVELNTEDLPLLGDTHVGVLDRHTAEDDKQESVSEGVVQADLAGDLLDGLHAGVLERQQAETPENQEESSALLSVKAPQGILGGLLNGLDVSALEGQQTIAGNSEERKGSLLSVGLETPLTGNLSLDVLPLNVSRDGAEGNESGGLLEINTDKFPILGNTHAGVLDRHAFTNDDRAEISEGVAQVDLENGLLDGVHAGVLETNRQENADGTTERNSGVSLFVPENDITGDLNISILENERFIPLQAAEEEGNDETFPTEENPVNPPVDSGDGNETSDSEGNNSEPGTDGTPGNDGDTVGNNGGTADNGNTSIDGNLKNEWDTDTDGTNGDQTTTPPTEGSDPHENGLPLGNLKGTGEDSGENGTYEAANSFENGMNTMYPVAGMGAGVMAGKSTASTQPNSEMDKGSMNDKNVHAGEMTASLPKTGGFFDTTILMIISMILLAAGFALRRFASKQ